MSPIEPAQQMATWVQLLVAVSGVVVPVLIVGIGVVSTLKVSSGDTRDRLSRMETSIRGIQDQLTRTQEKMETSISSVQEQLTGTREKIAFIQGRDSGRADEWIKP